jgi:hypothetical protein
MFIAAQLMFEYRYVTLSALTLASAYVKTTEKKRSDKGSIEGAESVGGVLQLVTVCTLGVRSSIRSVYSTESLPCDRQRLACPRRQICCRLRHCLENGRRYDGVNRAMVWIYSRTFTNKRRFSSMEQVCLISISFVYLDAQHADIQFMYASFHGVLV